MAEMSALDARIAAGRFPLIWLNDPQTMYRAMLWGRNGHPSDKQDQRNCLLWPLPHKLKDLNVRLVNFSNSQENCHGKRLQPFAK
jgi:hypothetical protein